MRRALTFVFVLAFLGSACAKAERAPQRSIPTSSPPATMEASKTGEAYGRKALLEIHAELAIDVGSEKESSELAQALTAHAARVSGWVESANVDANGAHLVLRIPPNEIEGARALLTGHGPLARESRTAKDVTDAIVDLDARVGAAKKEEARLLDLLEKKTGALADVLAVEKALADVRERIERMEAEQKSAHARVDLATVDVWVNVRGALDDAPISHQLAIAAREGVAAARTVAIGTVTTTLRVGPTLLPVAAAVALAIRAVRRRRSHRAIT